VVDLVDIPALNQAVAEAVLFLSTDMSAYVIGIILPIDGGRTLY